MNWLELSVEVERETAEAVAEVFSQFGHNSGVVIAENVVNLTEDGSYTFDLTKPVTVRTYLPATRASLAKKRRMEVALGHLSFLRPIPFLQEKMLVEEDWAHAWKAHFQVHRVGKRVVIKPSWQSYIPAPGEVVVELDPGMAFGTGLHPTTNACLQALEERLLPGMEVLDLGTGSGILAIAAAKLGAASVLALDLDPLAVKTAKTNVRGNGVQRRVKVQRGTLPLPEPGQRFALILANIIAQVFVDLARALVASLKPGGCLIASGIIQERQKEVEASLAQAGALPVEVMHQGDWLTLVYQTPSSP